MRTRYKIIAFSVVLGLLFWIIDAVLDYYFFYEEQFLGLLVYNVPAHEIYIRLVAIGGFLIFGIVIWRLLARRERAEETLRESEAELATIFDNSPAVMILVDQERRVRKANYNAVRFSGRAVEEMIGLHGGEALRCIHSSDDPKGCGFGLYCKGCPIRRTVVRTFKTRKDHYRVEAKLQFASRRGDVVVLVSTTLLNLAEGERVLVSIEDITERKRVEDTLRKSEKQASAAIEAARAITFNYDIASGKIEWGGAIEEITGHTIEEFAEVDIDGWAERIHPDDRDEILSILQEAMGKDRATAEYRFKTKKGYTTLSSISLTEKQDGKAVRLVGILQDITERKEAEQREKQLQAELIHSRRLAAIGELAAGIAHEINNPLTGILGFSERLLRKSRDGEARRDLARVSNEAQRVSRIVENLLTFARRREPKKEQIDVNAVLQRTLELRAYELKTSNIEVEVECASGLRKVMADFQRIQEVFLNLILNAEQAMGEANKGGKLGIKTERVKGGIRVSFADDGPGIPAENLDSLFDPFFTTRGESGGTGLGLSVCHGIVSEHDGRIYAESEEGKGATFFVELPVATKK